MITKSTQIKALSSILLSLCSPHFFGSDQPTEAQVREAAVSFLLAANIDHAGNGIVSYHQDFGSYTESDVLVMLDYDLKVKAIADLSAEKHTRNRLTFDPSLPALPQEQLIAAAKHVAAKVTSLDALTQVTVPNPAKIGATPRDSRRMVQISFSTEHPIRSESTGNYVAVFLDCQTGRLLSLTVSSGYEYESLDNLIPEQQAIAVAKAKIGSQETPDIVRLEYKAYTEGEEKRKICRPVYCIFIGKQMVYINAKTGAASEVFQWAFR